MPSPKSDMPFLAAYLVASALQLPLYLCAGLVWGGFMIVFAGWHLIDAILVGFAWGFAMWLLVGNILALGLAWRRSAELPAPDRAAFRTALERACSKLRLIVVSESADEVVLGPKRALVRFQQQEVRVEFVDGAAVLSAPAIVFGRIRKVIGREWNRAAAGGR